MLKKLFRLWPGKAHEAVIEPPAEAAPAALLSAAGVDSFDLAGSMIVVHDLPVPDWRQATAWVDSIADPAAQTDAWARAELAWLDHLRHALGAPYRVVLGDDAALLSTLDANMAAATLGFIARTRTRIGRVLEGLAQASPSGRDLLIVFEDQDTYYRYVSRYYGREDEGGEFAFSGGMHIIDGCSHFVTSRADMHAIEPVIAHEMTHAFLAHLPIPAWLNEGLAVNTERRLCPPPPGLHTPQELHAMHRRYWDDESIQTFWSGQSFLAADDGNLLSYELGRIIVEHLSRDWPRFVRFVQQARLADAGHDAASTVLGIDLGEAVSAMFGADNAGSWAPDPSRWAAAPERGGFVVDRRPTVRAAPNSPGVASSRQPRRSVRHRRSPDRSR